MNLTPDSVATGLHAMDQRRGMSRLDRPVVAAAICAEPLCQLAPGGRADLTP